MLPLVRLPQRLHQVELIEQREKLGPLVPCLCRPPLASKIGHDLLLADELKLALRDEAGIAIDG